METTVDTNDYELDEDLTFIRLEGIYLGEEIVIDHQDYLEAEN